MNHKRTIMAASLVLAALPTVGCGASGGPDKAGGEATPITLHLATQDRAGFRGAKLIGHFADQVRRRSGGSIRIVVTYNAAGAGAGFDQRVADLVRSGRVDLAMVPSRAWDVEGVRSLRALQTPFLLQTAEQVDRVVSDPQVTTMMLAGLRPLGVTGLGLVPESLRHPFAFHGTLRSLSDFAGAAIRAPRSNMSWAILRAVGAQPVDLDSAAGTAAIAHGTVKGAESDFAVANATLNTQTTATGNVTFFPRIDALVANSRALARLTADDRDILRRAAADTVTWAPSSNPGESAGARAFCRSGGRVVAASRAELAALTAAARPVTAALERDPVTRALISRIRALAGARSAEGFAAPTCQPPYGNAPSSVRAAGRRTPLDGIYRNALTVGDYTSAGVDQATAIQTAGIHTITLRNGRLHDTMRSDLAPQQPCDGSYSVHGRTFIFAWNTDTPCNGDFSAIWSLRGDELRFLSVRSDLGDRTLWGAKPFRKIG
jgi:TRAP-type C4-dicarboxylate transport system substrate-binding protein